jgi:predicted enzyme related to lactoylglutathione lyase
MYISTITVNVADVDRALAFYTETLGWEKTLDAEMGPGMRWVTVAPPGEKTCFVLVKGFGGDEPEKVGGQRGAILEVGDVAATHVAWNAKGVTFSEAPVRHPWGMWAQFEDSEGNVFGLHSP